MRRTRTSPLFLGMVWLLACGPATGPPPTLSATPQGAVSSVAAFTTRAGPVEQVVVALPTLAQSQLPYVLAREKGYYAEEGIEVDLQVVPPDLAVQGVLGGSFAFTGAGEQATIGRLGGAPVKVIFNHNHSATWWFVTPQQTGIKTLADLRGKTIGIEGPGTLSSTFTRALLRKHGLSPDSDVAFVSLGPIANWLGAVIGGTVDVGIAPDAEALVVGRQQGLTEIAFYGNELNAPLSGLATSEALMRENPDLVKRFLRGSIKGLRAYKAGRDEAVALAARALDQSPEHAARTYDVLAPLTSIDPILDERVQREFLELAREGLRLDAPVTPGDVYDYSLTREAMRELDAEGWVPR